MPYATQEDQNACQRRWYRRNRREWIKQVHRRSKQHVKILFEVVNGLKRRPCMDCGQSFHPIAMDFDHVRGKKRNDVSRLIKRACSLKTVLNEIAKCDLVCSNCHRIRTLLRRRGQKELGPVS